MLRKYAHLTPVGAGEFLPQRRARLGCPELSGLLVQVHFRQLRFRVQGGAKIGFRWGAVRRRNAPTLSPLLTSVKSHL